MKSLFLTLSFFAFSICASAQNVGIGNTDPKVPFFLQAKAIQALLFAQETQKLNYETL